jgi:hypothetical protein
MINVQRGCLYYEKRETCSTSVMVGTLKGGGLLGALPIAFQSALRVQFMSNFHWTAEVEIKEGKNYSGAPKNSKNENLFTLIRFLYNKKVLIDSKCINKDSD